MQRLLLGLDNQLGERLKGAFLLVVAFKIFLGVCSCGQCRIKRDLNRFVGVIVDGLKRFGSFRQAIAVCVNQFPINLVFFPFFSILQLLFLQVVFFAAAL